MAHVEKRGTVSKLEFIITGLDTVPIDSGLRARILLLFVYAHSWQYRNGMNPYFFE